MLQILSRTLNVVIVVLSLNIAISVEAAVPPSAAELERIGLQLNWSGQAVLDPSRDTIRYLTNDEDLVYVQSSGGVVSAFNAEVGRRMWVRQVGRNDAHSMPAVSNADLVVIVSGPDVFALDKFTGEEMFRYRLARHPSAAPAIGDSTVYIPVSNRTIYGFSIKTLIHLSRYETLPPGVARPYLWRWAANERVEYPPVATENVIAFGTTSRNLHAVSPAGISYYQEFLNGPPSAPLAVDHHSERRAIVVATKDRNLFSFDLTRGSLAWYLPLERRVSLQPLIVGHHVYLVMDAAGVACVSTRSGDYEQIDDSIGATERWFVPGVESLVGVAGDHLYGVDRNRRIVAVSTATAGVDGRAPMRGYSVHLQNSVTDRIYLASEAGELICLKPIGSDFATYHQRPDEQPLNIDVPFNDNDVDSEDAGVRSE
ncbi:MAG: PQQ-like beta-propeller repeat protein [Fuerstiella sp.]|nr:PQQ-like beta-propeller repeat protein [Fuerstiella sp.]